MIKALLFDKDGTLFDFDATWGRWAKGFILELSAGDHALEAELALAFDMNIETAKFNPTSPIIAGTVDEIMKAILTAIPSLTQDELMAIVQAGTSKAELAVVCDLPKLFNDLKDYALGIATNDGEASARSHLARSGVEAFFTYVAGWDSGFGAKPDAGMCTGFATHTGIAPKNIVMIGDSTHDMRAGRAAGMITLGALTGPADREELLPFADDVIASIEELPAWLAARR